MDFESFDLENLNTENSSVEMGYDTRKKIKSMLIGLINEGQKLIKETEKKCPPPKPTVVVKNVRFVPKGLTISHKKSPKHEEIKPEINFSCGICKTRFKAISLLSDHSKVCKSKNLKTDLPPTNEDEPVDHKIKNPGKQFNFNCGICKSDFETFEQLTKHSEGCKEVENIFEDHFMDTHDSSDHEDPEPLIEISLKCEICENNFKTLDQLAEHSKGCKTISLEMEVVDDSHRDNEDPKPEQRVENRVDLKPPQRIKLFKLKNGKYLCSVCKKLFENMKIGMIHMAVNHYPNLKFVEKGEKLTKNNKVKPIYHQINPIVFKCSTCLKNFNNYSNLTKHKLIHKQESTIEDDEEPIVVSEEVKKTLQESIKHNKELKLKIALREKKTTRTCNICDKKFYKNLKGFNDHIKTEHKTVETFQCKVCEKITFTKIALDSHMLLGHTKLMARKYQCEKCDHAPFTKEQALSFHMVKKHRDYTKAKKTNVCEICNKTFCDISGKDRHVATVHGNKCGFVCEFCGKYFNNGDRVSHYRTHSDERPFTCNQCDSKFRHNQDLTTHMRLHTGERPYECTICHQRFIANTNLTKHLKSRHTVKTGISID